MIFQNKYNISILAFLILFNYSGYTQNGITKNQHVVYEVDTDINNYLIKYTFKDPFGNLQTYRLSMPIKSTHNIIGKFGVPRWLFEPYQDTEYNKAIRIQELEKGLFKLNENTIVVDKSAVIDFYGSSFCKPIAEMIVRSLNDYGMDSRYNRIEFAMRYVQDIPYGIPEYEDDEMHYGGVNIIPKLLISGFGDCDSKVLLFAGIMVYLIPQEEFIFLNQPKHVLAAIGGNPETGQTFIRYKNKKYLLAETAGPGKRSLGEEGKYYRNIFKPEKLNINSTETIPLQYNYHPTAFPSKQQQVPMNTVVINNESIQLFKFQISYDMQNWESMTLEPNQTGNIKFENSGKKYLRYQSKNSNYQVIEIFTGIDYSFVWKARKKKWEVNF